MSQRKLKKQRAMEAIEVVKKVEYSGTGWIETWKKFFTLNWKYLLGMTLVIVLIYFNGLNANFVSDDYASITQNPQINNFKFMFNNGDSMSFSTYLVNQVFGSSSPIPYHAISLLSFIIFCWQAAFLIDLFFENKWLTWLTVGLFVVHPIHVEAVTWISGRNYVIVANYVMAGLTSFIFYTRKFKNKYLVALLALFFLAFLTDKPRSFALFLLIGVYVMYFGAKRFKINWGKFLLGSIAVGIVFSLISWPYIMNRINIVNGGYNASESIFYNPFFQYPTGLTKYFQLLWFPVDLTLYHTMYIIPNWLNWLTLLTYLSAMVYFFFKNKPYFLAMAWVIAGVMLSIMPVKVSWLVAERYMFLGSLGFSLLIALLVLDMSRWLKFVPGVMWVCLAVYFSFRTVMRNIDWQTNHNLWVNTCQVSPNSHNAWNNIGDDYDKQKDFVNAVKGFTQSTLVKPNYADAYHNRANIFYKLGRMDLARESYNIAVNLSPALVQSYISLTQIDLAEKKYDLALQHSESAYKLDQTNPQTAYILGAVKLQTGNMSEAKSIFENILRQYPNYSLAREALLQMSTGTTK